MIKPRVGKPPTHTPEILAALLEAVPLDVIPSKIAETCGVHRTTLNTWLERGEKDHEEGIDSELAQFTSEFYKQRALVSRKHLQYLSTYPTEIKAATFLLEKCFREDFGKESDELRELRVMFYQIMSQQQGSTQNDHIDCRSKDPEAVSSSSETDPQSGRD